MKKRIFALLTAAVMILFVLPFHAVAEEAHDHAEENYSVAELDDGKHLITYDCGWEVTEDCVFGLYPSNEIAHWTECNSCYNFIDYEEHELENCECTDEHCDYQIHEVEAWTPVTDDPNLHRGFCSACEQDITDYHESEWSYSESEHWLECSLCGLEEGDHGAHAFSDWYDYGTNKHYKYCTTCGYVLLAVHEDADGDGYCDVETCGDEVCINNDGDHRCDDCFVVFEDLCIDEDQDHVCDLSECGNQMYWECDDEDGDHRCDAKACNLQLEWACVDITQDHICDLSTCARYMREECFDDNGDYLCDDCGQNCCYHYYENDAVSSNGDGTHTGICLDCGESFEEECWDSLTDYNSTEHYAHCICDYEILRGAHTYEEQICVTRSLAGHWIMCDVCGYEHYEAHREANGSCEICGLEMAEVFDVYVGGKGLASGQYLDNAGNVSATKPQGGYAYYQDGVLELNGFTYEGIGAMWEESDYFESYAPVFAAKDLILVLTGENRISSVAQTDDEDDFYVYGDGIAIIGSLTVRGEGSLQIFATDDGIDVNHGDFTMESGRLVMGSTAAQEDVIGDDGIDADHGAVYIKGGSLSIYADDHGLDAVGSITISGGALTMVVGDDGMESNEIVTISGGKLDITADDEMIRGEKVVFLVDEPDEEVNNGENENDENTEKNESNKGNEVDGESESESAPDGGTPDAKPKLSGGAIAGITVGTVAVAELGGFSIFWFVIKKKKLSDLIGASKRS